MKALSSALLLILTLSGCLTGQSKTNNSSVPGDQRDPYVPDWTKSDITQLPISSQPETLASFAWDLAVINAPFEQKNYAYRLAKIAYEKEKGNKRIALTLSRTAYLAADMAPNDSEMKKFAEDGVAAAQDAGVKDKDPEANYYFALNLGLIVRAKGLFAINKLPDIAKALEIAISKPELDRGGPLRVAGMLYLKAPSWPQGIGDLEKAIEHLEKAVEGYPSHPLNYLFYAQAVLEDGDKDKAKDVLEKAKKLAVPELWGSEYARRWGKEIDDLMKKVSK